MSGERSETARISTTVEGARVVEARRRSSVPRAARAAAAPDQVCAQLRAAVRSPRQIINKRCRLFYNV